MSTTGEPGLPPPTPDALAILMTPTPTDRSAYVERFLRVMKVLRAGDHADEEALDPQRAERAFERGVNPAGYARQLAAIIASGGRRERLRALRTPTLVIHGDRDPLVPIDCGIDVARSVPAARMVTIEGMGHALPRRTWQPIVDAIAEHVRNGLTTEEGATMDLSFTAEEEAFRAEVREFLADEATRSAWPTRCSAACA